MLGPSGVRYRGVPLYMYSLRITPSHSLMPRLTLSSSCEERARFGHETTNPSVTMPSTHLNILNSYLSDPYVTWKGSMIIPYMSCSDVAVTLTISGGYTVCKK